MEEVEFRFIKEECRTCGNHYVRDHYTITVKPILGAFNDHVKLPYLEYLDGHNILTMNLKKDLFVLKYDVNHKLEKVYRVSNKEVIDFVISVKGNVDYADERNGVVSPQALEDFIHYHSDVDQTTKECLGEVYVEYYKPSNGILTGEDND